jgi:endonuclease/exonuclease/phosphatase family metal-dependent hydrolase
VSELCKWRVFEGHRKGPSLTVMTRNLYLGADTSIVLGSLMDGPEAMVTQAKEVFRQIQANRFHERAEVLVDKIEEARPDIVGMQEVVRAIHRKHGVETVTDFLLILEAELERRGLPYTFLPPQENTEVHLSLNGDEEVRFQDRIAVLVHQELPVTTVARGMFRATQPTPGGIVLRRGWLRVEVEVQGEVFHFVNTHLEVQPFAECQALQVRELMDEVVGAVEIPTFLFGDFNSNAQGTPGDPTWTPAYGEILEAGFRDMWHISMGGEDAEVGGKGSGYTCCHEGDLSAPGGKLNQRIDFIFQRGLRWNGPAPTMGRIGLDSGKMSSPNGLWPSDHAGLVVAIPFGDLGP